MPSPSVEPVRFAAAQHPEAQDAGRELAPGLSHGAASKVGGQAPPGRCRAVLWGSAWGRLSDFRHVRLQ